MSKATGQKFGRNKRAPSNSQQPARTAANKQRRIKKAEQVRQWHKAHPRVHTRKPVIAQA